MKKLTAVCLLVAMAVLFIYATVFAQSETVYIRPRVWDGRTVYSDQTLVIRVGWSTCRTGMIYSFLTASQISWSLERDGALVSSGTAGREDWSPIVQTVPGDASVCKGVLPTTLPRTNWEYSLGMLAAGDYTLHFNWWLDHPIIDGGDYDGDGEPDLFTGTLQDVDVQIHVEDR